MGAPGGAAATTAQLFAQLQKALDGPEGEGLVRQVKGRILFNIGGTSWALDLRPDSSGPRLGQGPLPDGDKPDLTLTMTDAVFAQLVMGKLNPQTVGARMLVAMTWRCRRHWQPHGC